MIPLPCTWKVTLNNIICCDICEIGVFEKGVRGNIAGIFNCYTIQFNFLHIIAGCKYFPRLVFVLFIFHNKPLKENQKQKHVGLKSYMHLKLKHKTGRWLPKLFYHFTFSPEVHFPKQFFFNLKENFLLIILPFLWLVNKVELFFHVHMPLVFRDS